MNVTISAARPTEPEVLELLQAHLEFSHNASPRGHVHALNPSGLADTSLSLFAARGEPEILGIGALRDLGRGLAEVKSMHVTENARGRGIGRLMLEHLIATARGRKYVWLGLETGTMVEFTPARSLYRSLDFDDCEPFGSYTQNPFSVCMSLDLHKTQ